MEMISRGIVSLRLESLDLSASSGVFLCAYLPAPERGTASPADQKSRAGYTLWDLTTVHNTDLEPQQY